MKIGILTFHFSNNYGAVLQCYALKTMLETLGYEVIIINRLPNRPKLFKRIYYFFAKFLFKQNNLSGWQYFNDERKKLLSPLTDKYYSTHQIKLCLKLNFDAVIVGSDQVWRYDNRFADNNYFLDFIDEKQYPNIKKIAYAASFGLDSWSGDIDCVSNLLRQFNCISVRENSGVKICNDIFHIDAIKVLDPTFLLNIEHYPCINAVKYNKNVVSYFLGSDKENLVSQTLTLCNKKNISYLDLYSLGEYDIEIIKHHITITDWLSYIKNSDFIITNSYHAMVFAILFHKKFAIIALESGGTSRIISTLSTLNIPLNNIYYRSLEDFSLNYESSEISWKDVDHQINYLRQDSINFLLKSLK